MKRKTVGAISAELSQKEPETNSPIELEREMQQEYMNNLVQAVKDHKSKWICDFYIVVITKNEKLMPNVFRNYFTARLSCPTPDYDQSVFKYNHKDEELEYIWTIPSRDACHHLKENALKVAPEERELLRNVIDFADGTLFLLSKKLNGEDAFSPTIIQ